MREECSKEFKLVQPLNSYVNEYIASYLLVKCTDLVTFKAETYAVIYT